MYYYVYDERALARESQRTTTKIETQINNLGLSGERGQVSALRGVEDLVRDAARKKYRPIIAVGEDATFNAALNVLAELKSDIPLGYIPIDNKQPMAQLLGVDPDNAVVSLSRRIIRTVPLARAGKAYFLSFVRCAPAETSETTQKKSFFERLFKKDKTTMSAVVTLDKALKASVEAYSISVHFSPQTQQLRLEVEGSGHAGNRRTHDRSVVWAKHLMIEGKPQLACLIDGRPVTRTPITVTVSDTRLPVIVGRGRAFA